MTQQRSAFVALAMELSGQQNILPIPRAFIDLTGDLHAALLLTQIVYWSGRTKNPDGWFYKTYEEWTDEITLSKYQVGKAVKILKPLGVKTEVRKANGAPTVHYRLDYKMFEKALRTHLETVGKSRNFTMESEETSQSKVKKVNKPVTEPTSEPTAEPTSTHSYRDPIPAREDLQKGKLTTSAPTAQGPENSNSEVQGQGQGHSSEKNKARPRDEIFDIVAAKSFRLTNSDAIREAKAGGRIGKVSAWVKSLAPPVSVGELQHFYLWYGNEYEDLHPPKDLTKFSECFLEYREAARKSFTRRGDEPLLPENQPGYLYSQLVNEQDAQ